MQATAAYGFPGLGLVRTGSMFGHCSAGVTSDGARDDLRSSPWTAPWQSRRAAFRESKAGIGAGGTSQGVEFGRCRVSFAATISGASVLQAQHASETSALDAERRQVDAVERLVDLASDARRE